MTGAAPAPRVTVPGAVVGAALQLVFSGNAILDSAAPTAELVAGAATGTAQALALLGLRTRPWTAVALFGVLEVARSAASLPGTAVGWAVAAYLMVRVGVPVAVPVVAAAVAATEVASRLGLLALGSLPGGPVEVLSDLGGDVLRAAAGIGVAGATGAALLGLQRRRERRAAQRARRRRAEALVRERRRITDELNGVVVAALQRLVASSTGLSDRLAGGAADDVPLGEVQDRARQALAAMRRVLVVLRQPPPGEAPDAPARPATVPLPTRSGVALTAVVVVAAVALGLSVELLPLELDQLEPDQLTPWRSGPVVLALLGVQAVAGLWWRSAPVLAFALASGCSAAVVALDGSDSVLGLAWFALVWSVGASAGTPSWLVVLAGLAAPYAAVLAWDPGYLLSATDAEAVDLWVALVTDALLAVALWWWGRWSGARSRRQAARARAEERSTLSAVEDERHRVARELHDVVAHLVSALAVQAAAARACLGDGSDTVREAVRNVEEQGVRIAAALPRLADLAPVGEILPLTPDGVAYLLAPLRAAGLPVTAHVTGEPAATGEAGLFAQRILTEALTNALRHAGRSPTRVAVHHDVDAVSVTVTDSGPAPGAASTRGAGFGLVGMRERARLLGGELSAGPAPGGGWRVAARLPLVAPPAAGVRAGATRLQGVP